MGTDRPMNQLEIIVSESGLEKPKAEQEKNKAILAEQLKLAREKQEKERLREVVEKQIECPFCHERFNLPKE